MGDLPETRVYRGGEDITEWLDSLTPEELAHVKDHVRLEQVDPDQV